MKKFLFVCLVVMMGVFALQSHVSAMMDDPEPVSIEQAKLDTLNVILDRVSALLRSGGVDTSYNEKRKMVTFSKEPYTLFIIRKDLREWDQNIDPPATSKIVYDIEVWEKDKAGAGPPLSPPVLKMENYYFQESNEKSKEIYVKTGLLYMEVYAKFLKKKNLEYLEELEKLRGMAFLF